MIRAVIVWDRGQASSTEVALPSDADAWIDETIVREGRMMDRRPLVSVVADARGGAHRVTRHARDRGWPPDRRGRA